MSDKISIGLLGISRNWRYLASHCKDLFNILAVSSRDQAKAILAAPLAKVVEFQEICTNEGIQVVFVSLPTSLKCSWILKCLKSGKSVITEPPLCSNENEAKQIQIAAEAAKKAVSILTVLPKDVMNCVNEVEYLESNITIFHEGQLANPCFSGGATIVIGSLWLHQIHTIFEGEPSIEEYQIEAFTESSYFVKDTVDSNFFIKARIGNVQLRLNGALTTNPQNSKEEVVMQVKSNTIRLEGKDLKNNPFLSTVADIDKKKCSAALHLIPQQIQQLYQQKGLNIPGTSKGVLRFFDPWQTPQGTTDIVLSSNEIASNQMSEANLKFAGLQLHAKGFVTIQNAIPLAEFKAFQQAFLEVYNDCSETKTNAILKKSLKHQAVFWDDSNRRRMFPKIVYPFDSEHLITNPFVMQILTSLMEKFYCAYFSSDINQPGSMLQAPHRDVSYYEVTEHRFYIVNIPLVDITFDHGPTEVWPVSHHINCSLKEGIEKQDEWNLEAERIAGTLPSQFLLSNSGSIIIRHPGMWHRGTPNISNEIRPMFTICYAKNNFLLNYGTGWNWDEEHPSVRNPALGKLFKAKYFPLL